MCFLALLRVCVHVVSFGGVFVPGVTAWLLYNMFNRFYMLAVCLFGVVSLVVHLLIHALVLLFVPQPYLSTNCL